MISFAPLAVDAVDFLLGTHRHRFFGRRLYRSAWFCVTARRPDGTLKAVLVGEFKQPFDCHLTMAVDDIPAPRRELLMAIFATHLQPSAGASPPIVPPDNQRSLKQLQRLGFVYEGFCAGASTAPATR